MHNKFQSLITKFTSERLRPKGTIAGLRRPVLTKLGELFSPFMTRTVISAWFMPSALYAITRPSECINNTKAVEVRIMKFSPYVSPITLVTGPRPPPEWRR